MVDECCHGPSRRTSVDQPCSGLTSRHGSLPPGLQLPGLHHELSLRRSPSRHLTSVRNSAAALEMDSLLAHHNTQQAALQAAQRSPRSNAGDKIRASYGSLTE